MLEKTVEQSFGDDDETDAHECIIQQLKPYLTASDRKESLGRLGRYEVLQVIGRGGFGIVLKAFDKSLHRVVAIKVLAPNLAVTSPPRKRFVREARAAAQVKHENVVQIYSVEEEPLPHLVMEFIDGQTLQEKLDDAGPFDPSDVVQFGKQIANGLAAAHEKWLIHRDVKPANILLENGPQARIKLTDFGLARTSDDASLTQSGVLVGTPLYMAPEMANGGPLTTQADLFSLGGVLYTMLCGRPPFRAPTTAAILKRVVTDTPRPICDIIPNAPRQLSVVISRLLQKNPADRYVSAAATAEAISCCLTQNANLNGPVARSRRALGFAFVAVIAILSVIGLVVRTSFLKDHSAIQPAESNLSLIGTNSTASSPELPPTAQATERSPEFETSAEDRWKNAVALMEPEDRVLSVIAQFKKRNPEAAEDFCVYKMKENQIDEFRLKDIKGISDFSPLAGLGEMRELAFDAPGFSEIEAIRGFRMKTLSLTFSEIKDLGPLSNTELVELWAWGNKFTDLSPLRGLKIAKANLGSSPLSDISPLYRMPLDYLCLNYTHVNDLSPLRESPLAILECQNTPVRDISPLATLPLEELYLAGCEIEDFGPIRNLKLKKISLDYDATQHSALLRSIATLEVINKMPAAEFLGHFDHQNE